MPFSRCILKHFLFLYALIQDFLLPLFSSVQPNSLNIFFLSSFSCFPFLALVIFSNVSLWTVPSRVYWPLPSPYFFFFGEIDLLCFECSMLTMCQPFLILGIEYILLCSPGFYYFSISFLRSSCLIPLSHEMISKYLFFQSWSQNSKQEASSLYMHTHSSHRGLALYQVTRDTQSTYIPMIFLRVPSLIINCLLRKFFSLHNTEAQCIVAGQ